jgi:hypothetical protein
MKPAEPPLSKTFSRRSAIGTLLAGLAAGNFTPWTISTSQSQEQGVKTMSKYAVNQKTIGDAVANGGILVVAQWEAKEGQADTIAGILDRFLPEAQRDPGSQLFLIGRNKENPRSSCFTNCFAMRRP